MAILIPPARCPCCAEPISLGFGEDLEGSQPKPGDVVLCPDCAAVLFFGPDMGLLSCSDDFLRGLDETTARELAYFQNAIRAISARRGARA